MSTKFKDFIREIVEEAHQEGRAATEQLAALQEFFRNVRKHLQETKRLQNR